MDPSSSRSAKDDRRRSIITGRLAGHLFQGEVCSKRGTWLTFEIIFKVERSALDLHTLASAQYREDRHIHTRNIHNVASSLMHTQYIPRGWLPLRGMRGVTGSRNRSRRGDRRSLERFDSISRNGEGRREEKGPYELSRGIGTGTMMLNQVITMPERLFEFNKSSNNVDKPFII